MSDPQSVGEALGLVALGLYTAWNSRRAKKLSEPTGNGFAADVKDALRRIERKQGQIETKIDQHLLDHSANDVRGKS